MDFGSTLTNPLLQVAVGAVEATIRHACGGEEGLAIHVEMDQFADGRDAIQVTLRTEECASGFSMLLRNYFDRAVLWRVARRAWLRRTVEEVGCSRVLEYLPMACVVGRN